MEKVLIAIIFLLVCLIIFVLKIIWKIKLFFNIIQINLHNNTYDDLRIYPLYCHKFQHSTIESSQDEINNLCSINNPFPSIKDNNGSTYLGESLGETSILYSDYHKFPHSTIESSRDKPINLELMTGRSSNDKDKKNE